MTLQIINYYNHKIAYSVTGKGLPLVFLHGFGENRHIWKDFVPSFKAFKVVVIDFPGAGDSVVMKASIARMAKIVNAVLRKENIEKCLMIGHSMGGYVTLAFAKLYEEKLLGYCLFHSQAYADSSEKKEGRNKAISFVKNYGNALFFKGLIPKLFSSNFLKSNEFIVNSLIFYGSQMPTAGVINQLKAMRDRPDNQVILKDSAVPVCFIIGKNDTIISAENSLNQTFLPSLADIHILPKVGHLGMFEAKKETISILKRFIEFCQAFID